jgi:uncharacterized protein with HEPN domain
MQRDILLLTEMIDAAEQAHQLTAGITIGQLETDRQRYWSIDLEILHTTAAEQLPAFAADLRHVLGNITESA